MSVTIYCMGFNKDYVELNIDSESVKQAILKGSERGGLEGGCDGVVENMRSDRSVPAERVCLYGPTVKLSCETSSKIPYYIGVNKFFQKVDKYAREHGANSVVVNNFHFSRRMGSNAIDGLAQLMVER